MIESICSIKHERMRAHLFWKRDALDLRWLDRITMPTHISDIFKVRKQSLSCPKLIFQMGLLMARSHEPELLMFLKLFKRQELVGLSFEKKDNSWSLFLHFPNGIIQISGRKELKDTVYASLITETVPWER